MANICKYQKKFGKVLYVERILLFKLIIAQTITKILSSKSICVWYNILQPANFFSCPMTLLHKFLHLIIALKCQSPFQTIGFFSLSNMELGVQH